MNRATFFARRTITLSPAEADAIRVLEQQGATIRRDASGKILAVEAVGQLFADDITISLRSLKNLQHLSLIFTQVTSRGLTRLADLLNLEAIDLGGNTQIDDDGARSVAKIYGLESVSLWDTAITDAGALAISQLPRIKNLYLSGTRISDSGLAHLCTLKRLAGLDIHATKVTDKGMSSIGKMTNLEWLDLSFTNITDKGLKSLESLVALKRLHLKYTQVSSAGIAQLRQKLPQCRVLLAA